MMNNKMIRRTCNGKDFYVIEATRDGVRKYVAENFPYRMSYCYTVKLNCAMQFPTMEAAKEFIDSFVGSRYEIKEAEIKIAVVKIMII